MISTGELRKGVTIELDNELWQILDYHHIKMGRGSAQVRITLRNVKRGQTIERSFQAGTKWPRAQLEQRPVQFLYRDGDDFHFMDTDTYDQFVLRSDQLGDATRYLHKVSGPFDLIFQDSNKQLYEAMLDRLVELLRPGGVLVSDNILWSGEVVEGYVTPPQRNAKDTEALRAYNKRLAADPRLLTTFVPVGDGLAVCLKLP